MNDFEWTEDIQYPDYKKGDIVTVPVSSTGRDYAIIDSHEYSGGYQVIGPSISDQWRRWVRLDYIKNTDYTCKCEIGYIPHTHSSNCKQMNEIHG
jgi:hypothetical protein